MRRLQAGSWIAAALVAGTQVAAAGPARVAPRPPVAVEQAWVRASPPGATGAAAYLTLRNATARPVTLVAARSRDAQAVEFHSTVREGERVGMRPMARVTVPARGTARFEPGGSHIMLIGIRRMLRAGSSVPMTLVFSNGDSLALVLPVKPG